MRFTSLHSARSSHSDRSPCDGRISGAEDLDGLDVQQVRDRPRQLREGQIYTLSQDRGHPGGAFADPSLIIPKHGDVVFLGGAEGLVVGGTGKYRNASGLYSTRLKVETIDGFFVYYDELFFRFREVDI
jgi:hypothetical protein